MSDPTVTEAFDDPNGAKARANALGRLGRYLTSPLRRLVARSEDPQAVRAASMTDEELADALSREVFAAQNADDEVWIEGAALIDEAARRLRTRAATD